MFTSFRQRLLFCFILIIGISFVIVTLTHFHFLFRNNVIKTTSAIESAYVLVLKDINIKQNFFTYDTHNTAFFKSQESKNLEAHRHLADSIRATIDLAVRSFDLLPYTFDHELFSIEKELKKNQVLFDSITLLIQKRGYKDYNLEGSMRNHIHWLENNKTIPNHQILALRRLEKDYIIRNEREYVSKLNELGTHMLLKYATGRDSVKYHLNAYTSEFNQMVALDAKIGLKDNSGLKQQLDLHTNKLEQALNQVVINAREKQDRSFSQLNKAYIALISFLMLLSVVASVVISRKITRPLTELTEFITRFIDSQFTVEEQTPPVRSQDEIGKLTANFTLLKNEVITHLRFFKQKVDERTAELQTAHKKLIETNEANSRFVPKEFLDLLGKTSVIEVSPGDQLAGEMTVLFTDIRSFTEISESLSPQDNFDFINDYLKEMVPVVKANNGVIDKFIGDTVMAIFPGSPDDAMKAALGFTEAVERLNIRLAQKGIAPITTGTGIHMGQLVLGTVGNSHRLETTVISDAVNIASRIEGLTKYYQAGIIVSEEVLQHAQQLHGLNYRYLDEVRVKGKLRSVRVYEVLHPEKDRRKIMFLREYENGIKYLKQKKFSDAMVIFSELSMTNPQDNLPKILLQRCQKLIDHGIPHEWDGIEIMQSK